MNDVARGIQRTYLTLLLGNTLAASFIWGINTLFLLDAGLSNLEAFAANAFFTAGMMIFEVPTGVIADTWGRRTSYLLGTVTLAASTFLYFVMWQVEAPFWLWAVVSVLIGLGLGGVIAQATTLGVPCLLRVVILLIMFVVAFMLMKDLGFSPEPTS